MRIPLLACTAAAALLALPAAARATDVGVTMALFDDNFLTNIREAMGAHAETMEDVSLQFEDAQADIGRQINQVQNFIAQGVDAIVVNPADTAATQAITDMVAASGIPLVYVNRGPFSFEPFAESVHAMQNVADELRESIALINRQA